MSSASSLKGLMKWLERAEWRGPFTEVYDTHLLPACEQTGVDADEVISILGQDWFMTSVWGSAFEDFLTLEMDDGSNIVDEYLKRRGWKESASTRAYMAALRTSVTSLYEVSDVVPGTSFRARDLVRGGEPVLISERSATRSLKQWHRIAARVVQVGSQTVISGAVLPYRYEASEHVLKVLRNVARPTDKKKRKDRDAGGLSTDDAFVQADTLRTAAPMITTMWLIDCIDRATHIPRVRNTEGDDLLFCTAHFPFAGNITADDIRPALTRCGQLRQKGPTFWNWFDQTSSKPDGSAESLTFATFLDDGSLVLGDVELKGKAVVLSVNSQARCERGRALLCEILGGLVAQPLIEMQTLEQLESSPRGSPAGLDLPEEERRAIIHETMDRHYRETLDQPVQMLGNKSPRAAAKTAKGRVKVADWLKMIENQTAQCAGKNDDMATYDFSWLWAELGLIELRR